MADNHVLPAVDDIARALENIPDNYKVQHVTTEQLELGASMVTMTKELRKIRRLLELLTDTTIENGDV